MTALSKFLVLLANFLSASHENAFTSLSSVAGNQQVNYLIQLQQPMSNPMNEPNRESTCKPTNDLSIDLWQCRKEIDKMNSMKKSQPRGQCQDKISEQVSFSKQEKDAELPYHLLPKHTQQSMIINAFSLDEKSSAMFKLVVVSMTSEYSNGSFKFSLGASQPFNRALALTAKVIVALTFERSIKMQPIFQLIDVFVPNKNDSCSAFQMVAHGHNTFIESTSFNNSSFQLVVEFIIISNSEEAHAPTITASAKAALTFFNIEFKLIVKSASDASRFEQLTVPNNDPSLFLSFIGVIILEGAQFAPTTYQAFELIVALIHQQATIFCGRSPMFIVECFSKGRKNKAKMSVSQGVQHNDFLLSNNTTEHRRKPQQDLVAAWSSIAILNVSLNNLIKLNNLIGLNDFNSLFSLSFNQDPLIVVTKQNPFSTDSFKLISEFISEGAQFTPATLQTFKLIDAFDHQ
jgi:hypothetical protein